MRKRRLFFLIKEYRLAHERLNELESEAFRVKVVEEVSGVLGKDLKEEFERANKTKDKKTAHLYKQAIDKHFSDDRDKLSDKDSQYAERSLSEEAKSLLVYYETKIRAIKKLLGIRNAELVDTYDEKSMFIGGQASDSRLRDDIEEEEERANKKDPSDFTFGKM